MSEATEVAEKKPAKEKTPVTVVEMSDGRKVEFAGKRKMLKAAVVNAAGIAQDGGILQFEEGALAIRLDFVNGVTRLFPLALSLIAQYATHGAEQKYGDQTAGTTDVDDMIEAVDDLHDHLSKGEWSTRKEGDGFAGASVVIRAIMEASGKDQEFVKTFLQQKLDAAKAKGESLTRKELYDSFRKPGTKTAAIIKRLEEEKLSKASKVDADA